MRCEEYFGIRLLSCDCLLSVEPWADNRSSQDPQSSWSGNSFQYFRFHPKRPSRASTISRKWNQSSERPEKHGLSSVHNRSIVNGYLIKNRWQSLSSCRARSTSPCTASIRRSTKIVVFFWTFKNGSRLRKLRCPPIRKKLEAALQDESQPRKTTIFTYH